MFIYGASGEVDLFLGMKCFLCFSTIVAAFVLSSCSKPKEEEAVERSRESQILDATKKAAEQANEHTERVNEAAESVE